MEATFHNQEINKKRKIITGPKRSIDKRIAERKSSFAFLCQQKTRFEIARVTKKHLWLLVLFFSFFISQQNLVVFKDNFVQLMVLQ